MSKFVERFWSFGERRLSVECNGMFPLTGNIVGLGAAEAHANVLALAEDIVCHRAIVKQSPVQICAAIIVGCVFAHPTSFICFLLRSIAQHADSLIQSFLDDAPTLIAEISEKSKECAEIFRSGLEAYSRLAEDQRARLIENLKDDAGRYYLTRDIDGKEISKPYPVPARRAAASLALIIGTLCAIFVPYGWLPVVSAPS